MQFSHVFQWFSLLQICLHYLTIEFVNIHIIFRYWIMHLYGFLISISGWKTNQQLNYAIDLRNKIQTDFQRKRIDCTW